MDLVLYCECQQSGFTFGTVALDHTVLTKEMKTKDGLDSLLYKNRLGAVLTWDNSVKYRDGEFEITGRKLRAKLAPKKNPPMKHKVKKVKNEEVA